MDFMHVGNVYRIGQINLPYPLPNMCTKAHVLVSMTYGTGTQHEYCINTHRMSLNGQIDHFGAYYDQ